VPGSSSKRAIQRRFLAATSFTISRNSILWIELDSFWIELDSLDPERIGHLVEALGLEDET